MKGTAQARKVQVEANGCLCPFLLIQVNPQNVSRQNLQNICSIHQVQVQVVYSRLAKTVTK